MWHTLQQTSRVLLATMAFSMAFVLTPRSWIPGAQAPSSPEEAEQVPVDTLEGSDSCLWCDESEMQQSPCRRKKNKWLSPETRSGYTEGDCEDGDDAESGPNA